MLTSDEVDKLAAESRDFISGYGRLESLALRSINALWRFLSIRAFCALLSFISAIDALKIIIKLSLVKITTCPPS